AEKGLEMLLDRRSHVVLFTDSLNLIRWLPTNKEQSPIIGRNSSRVKLCDGLSGRLQQLGHDCAPTLFNYLANEKRSWAISQHAPTPSPTLTLTLRPPGKVAKNVEGRGRSGRVSTRSRTTIT